MHGRQRASGSHGESIAGHHRRLFGAITSKAQDKAKEELSPELQGKGLSYFSPIVGLRQLFHLHTNMRPCKSYPGNPLNYRGNKITNPSGVGCASRSGGVS